jgi:hypothetical protein
MTAPASGATVSGSSVTLSATASDNIGVAGVQFKLDGTNLGAEDTASPYTITWDSTTTTNGSHTLTATARDAAGNTTTSTGVAVTVSNDTTPPTVAMTAPASGATVSGSSVTLSATAGDNVGVVGVQFKLDGVNLGAEDTTSPYTITWDSTPTSTAAEDADRDRAYAAGNTTTSTGVGDCQQRPRQPLHRCRRVRATCRCRPPSLTAAFTTSAGGELLLASRDGRRSQHVQLRKLRGSGSGLTWQAWRTNAQAGWRRCGARFRPTS